MSKKAVKSGVLLEGWRRVKLGTIGTFSKGSGITKSELVENGIPCVRYGEIYTRFNFKIRNFYSFVSEEKSHQRKIIRDNGLLFAGSGETKEEIGKCVSFNFKTKVYAGGDVIIFSINPQKLRADFASYYLNTVGRKQINKLGQGDSIVHIYGRFLENVDILFPPLPEQKAIASLLETWDTAIEKTEALIAAKEKRLKWQVTAQITKAGHKKVPVSTFTKEISARNRNTVIQQVLSVTNRNGFKLPEEQFERRIASADLSNYKVVSKGEYAYNPSRINVGSIARLDEYNIGALSPMYVVFAMDEQKVCSDYFLHWLSAGETKQRINNSAQGSVRETVNFTDFGSILFPMPPMKEQLRIAEMLNTAKDEISVFKQFTDQYRLQKRGLMQKLLTGKWRLL